MNFHVKLDKAQGLVKIKVKIALKEAPENLVHERDSAHKGREAQVKLAKR